MKLSIAIITRNRRSQLKEALLSCVHSNLPLDTQFVIIDNASEDDTEILVRDFFTEYHFEYIYEKMSSNLGVGIGRNYAYSRTRGDYVYFMDDDAYIDEKCKHFFTHAIEILDKNPKIATLTTQIYDLLWQKNRVTSYGPIINGDIRYCRTLCGGSHFLSRHFFRESAPYFPNKYGYEEIIPSLRVIDSGYINAFIERLLVIHNPLVNKWDYNIESNEEYLIKGIVIPMVMKSKLYPYVFLPFVYLAYNFRCRKYLNKNQIPKAKAMMIEMTSSYEWDTRISFKSVIKMLFYFGLNVF